MSIVHVYAAIAAGCSLSSVEASAAQDAPTLAPASYEDIHGAPTIRLPSPHVRPRWSRRREAADYRTWIAAVPAKHRALVRSWVRWCGPRGRRDGWELAHDAPMTPARVRELGKMLLSFARENAKNAPVCALCRARKISVVCDGSGLCRACVSPFDRVAA